MFAVFRAGLWVILALAGTAAFAGEGEAKVFPVRAYFYDAQESSPLDPRFRAMVGKLDIKALSAKVHAALSSALKDKIGPLDRNTAGRTFAVSFHVSRAISYGVDKGNGYSDLVASLTASLYFTNVLTGEILTTLAKTVITRGVVANSALLDVEKEQLFAQANDLVLTELAADYPLPARLLEHRSLAQLKGTYTDKLPQMINPATGRVHTHYAQAVAVTGRLASNEPNLQNIPIRTAEGRKVREAFIAPPGHLILSADYSQIELRIMAHISEDPGLLKAFSEGMDVHRATASEVFGIEPAAVTTEQRRYAKTINFGLIYGMGAFGLAQSLGIERSAAAAYIERYFERFAGVKRYMDTTRESARDKGYVETLFGRRVYLPEINGGNGPRKAGAERQAINAPMQGTAADLIKLAMLAVQRVLDEQHRASRIVMQVHDELVLEVPEAELEWARVAVPAAMASVAALKVPLLAEVGVGHNWDEAH